MRKWERTKGIAVALIFAATVGSAPAPVETLAATTESASVETSAVTTESASEQASEAVVETETAQATEMTVSWDDSWEFASSSKVHEAERTIYLADASVSNGHTVAINPGHGSIAAQNVMTLCHPDGTPKVVGGSTAAGATEAIGANCGTQLLDGAAEYLVVLDLALQLKDVLLERGYNVLMLRETEDCDMDNIARTVYANNCAECHIAIHYDSSDYDKGLYYTGVPDLGGYRQMYPVSEHWQEHDALGRALIMGAQEANVKIWESGCMEVDLTQTSYSTVASVDLEVGDRGSEHSEAVHLQIANGLADGLDLFFGIE